MKHGGRSFILDPRNVVGAVLIVGLILTAVVMLLRPVLVPGESQGSPGAPADGDMAAAGFDPTGQPCTELRVMSAASFAPVLQAVAPTVATGQGCVTVVVTVTDGRQAVAAAATSTAHVWVPDDVSWGAGAPEGLLAESPQAGALLAASPVYWVAGSTAAAALEAAGGSWTALAQALEGTDPPRLVTSEPGLTGDGLVGLGAILDTVWAGAGMDAASGALSGASKVSRTVDDPATARLAADEVALVTEHDLLAAGATPAGATVLAPTDASAMLRFTWLPLTTDQSVAVEAARSRVLAALSGPDGVAALGTAGLRSPDLTPPPGALRLPATAPTAVEPLRPHHVEHVFAAWYPADRVADVLLVIDISGSMFAQPPDSDQPLITEAKAGVMAVAEDLPDDARLGIWEFGTNLDPPRDYRTVVATSLLTPIARIDLAARVDAMNATDTGTGLHDTILAAYLDAAANQRPGVRSQVLVFTDGKNEADGGSLTLEELGQALVSASDPRRPVAMSVVVFGPEEQAAGLGEVLDPVGGYVATVQTAQDVANAFAHVAAGGLHG